MRYKIALCGTPSFVINFFEQIYQDKRYEVVCVITQAAKPNDRGNIIKDTPVAKWAKKRDILCFEVDKLSCAATGYDFSKLHNLLSEVETVLLFAFGKIIPQALLDLPKFGWVNVHPSRLPDLRGPSPIQYSILKNLPSSSLTFMQMDSKMDEGNILDQYDFKIHRHHTSVSLLREICSFGPAWISDKLFEYLSLNLKGKAQIGEATYSQLIKNSDYFASSADTVAEILSKVKAFGYLIFKAQEFGLSIDIKCFGAENAAYVSNKKWLRVKVRDGEIVMIFVQKAGGKRMHINNFMNGYRL